MNCIDGQAKFTVSKYSTFLNHYHVTECMPEANHSLNQIILQNCKKNITIITVISTEQSCFNQSVNGKHPPISC